MRCFRVEGADAAALGEELKETGAVVRSDAEGVYVEHGEDVDGVQVDVLVRRYARRLIVERVKQAEPGTPERTEAVNAALDELLRL